MARIQDTILPPGTRAAQPSAASAGEAAVYYVTDEGKLERSDGTAWQPFSTSGAGDVVGPAASVNSEAALFNGTTGKLLKRATGTGVVHWTSGVASVSNVTEAEQTLADNTTNNVTTSAHGYAPKSPNDATKFLNGASPPAWAVPPSGNVVCDVIATDEAQASNTVYGDLTTVGPTITRTLTGTVAAIWMNVKLRRPGGGGGFTGMVGVDISGSTTRAPDFTFCISSVGSAEVQASALIFFTGLTPGTMTFKFKYRNDGGGTWNFRDRFMQVNAV